MNTLRKRKIDDTSKLTVTTFRDFQYESIKYFIYVAMEYFLKFGNRYINLKNIEFKERINYMGLANSCFSDLIITTDIHNSEGEKTFMNVLIPTLIDGYMFCLNGTTYVPALYIVDYPIIIKEKSIQFYGLLNGLTIYFKDDIAILTGTNIPLSYFFQLFLEPSIYNEFLKNHKKQHHIHSEGEIILYFENTFGVVLTTIDKVKMFISNILFDLYTKDLYTNCYNSCDLSYLLGWAVKRYLNEDIFNFVDLKNKRLIFIELLLRPIFEKIANFAKQTWRGILYDEIKIDNMAIIKFRDIKKSRFSQQQDITGNSEKQTDRENRLFCWDIRQVSCIWSGI